MYTQIASSKINDPMPERVSKLLAESWKSRVAVKTCNLDAASYYDQDIPDYPADLVPFRDDPRYKALDIVTRKRILAGAWVAYNEKTIDVEVSIVAPACNLLLTGVFPGFDTAIAKRIIAQTQVDEQFHILMCLEACLLARKMHNIENLLVPKSLVVRELEKAVAAAVCPRDADIVRLAFSVVAEVTINGYLNLLANDQSIQPFNRETTELHRRDESSHNKIFKNLARDIYLHFDEHARAIFKQALTSGLDAFVRVDLAAWREVLLFVGVADADADDMIAECRQPGRARRIVRDYSGFRSLLSEIGIAESDIRFEFDPV